MDTNGDAPGYLHASTYTDHLAREDDASDAEVARLQHVYGEIERRDGAAQWHTSLWRHFAYFLGALLAGSVGLNVYFSLKASQVQAFVQLVQLTEDGHMVLIGIPQDVLAYEPSDGQWMDMLAEWTRKRYWVGDDPEMKRTRSDWLWLYGHSCGAGSAQLAAEERKEQPFKLGKKRTSIEITSITRTATPESFQVLWKEVSVDKLASTKTEHAHTTTFTVGRIRPKTLTEAMDNRLGLCVSGYDDSPKHTKIP